MSIKCENCAKARQVVNKKYRGDRVGCILATDSDYFDEFIREKTEDVKEMYIYPEKDSTIREVGVTVGANFNCKYFIPEGS